MADRRPFPRLFPRLMPVPDSELKSNGNGKSVIQTKAAGTTLLPKGAYGDAYEFFSPDGGRTFIEFAGGSSLGMTAYAFVAYWYVAVRWRAQKIAEAPLMVVEEDQDDGSEEWLSDHPLVDVLDQPSDDYDMGEMLERTSRYLDNHAEAIWTLDMNGLGEVGRMTPFHREEFRVESSSTRLYDRFIINNTQSGPKTFPAERVCYFRDSADDLWTRGGKSRLDVAMSWLRLGEKARATIRDLLDNSVWPSAVDIMDKDWSPDPETLNQYKQDLELYAQQGQRGRPFVKLGGGSFQVLSRNLRDLVPEEILNRVESVVAAVSGVPAIVLQFQVGMENSPWSQMAQARRMAYEDTIAPTWRRIERVLTRQLLRPIDEDKTHFIRFDRSNIESLKDDQLTLVQTATLMGKAASLNERRKVMQLEPVNDPKADEIPELTQPSLEELLAGNRDNQDGGNEDDPKDPTDAPPDNADKTKARQLKAKARIERKAKVAALTNIFRADARVQWQATIHPLLMHDAQVIGDIIRAYITPPVEGKSTEIKAARGKDKAMTAVIGYLKEESSPRWARATTPLLVQAAQRSTAVVAADVGVSYNLLHPSVLKFAQKETGMLIDSVTKTTRDKVRDVITKGLEENLTASDIADRLSKSAGFAPERAELIARTETARVFNGAPHDSLRTLARSTGRRFVKTWFTAGDDNVRDEHQAMEGETVPIDEQFSNGSDYPDEPNERCTAVYTETTEEDDE